MISKLAALDHERYLRLGLVLLNNMKCLSDSIKEVFDQKNFTVKKPSRVFSVMGFIQVHEATQ